MAFVSHRYRIIWHQTSCFCSGTHRLPLNNWLRGALLRRYGAESKGRNDKLWPHQAADLDEVYIYFIFRRYCCHRWLFQRLNWASWVTTHWLRVNNPLSHCGLLEIELWFACSSTGWAGGTRTIQVTQSDVILLVTSRISSRQALTTWLKRYHHVLTPLTIAELHDMR